MTSSISLAPWPVYEQDEIDAVVAVLESGKVNLWTGDHGKQFEVEFAAHCGANYAIALTNGTAALELALEAAGVGPGDDVIVTPRTFMASASCVVRLGARPVFADVSIDSQNITPESVQAVITPSTRAVVAVHHAGWPCDMDGLIELAIKHNFLIIEDCAQAHGATYKGRPAGGIGHIGAYSFCQDKIMTTGGEGGMVVTNDETYFKRAWAIKDHGKSHDAVFNRSHAPGFRWLIESFGTNMRMTEMQAAIGRLQLKKLKGWNEQRNDNARRIVETLSEFKAIRSPEPSTDIVHARYRQYAFVAEEYLAVGWDRDRIMNAINARGIPCSVGSCPEIYNEKAFDKNDLRPTSPLPNAQVLGSQSLAFLVHPTLTCDQIGQICGALHAVMTQASR